MALKPDVLMGLEIAPVRKRYDWRDSAIYALGLGYGDAPCDERHLRFVTENNQQAVPTMVNVHGHDGSWMRREETGIDYLRLVHGEQAMRIHRPLPASGEIISQTTIEELVDKGEGNGALVRARRDIRDAQDGELYATVWMTLFCRGAGGFGGKRYSSTLPHPQPPDAPQYVEEIATLAQGALIYRLSGDYNPLHSDPQTAMKAGFDAPILHGLATFGIACRALMTRLCDSDASRVTQLDARFSAPVYPGETIAIDIWPQQSGQAAFRARVGERDVLKNGLFRYQT